MRYLHLQHHNWLAATLFALFGLLPRGQLTQAQEPQQSAPKLSQFSVQVAAIGSDKVPAKAEVQFSGRIGPNPVNLTLAVDADGKATLEFEPDAEVRNLWFTARAPGFVPVHYVWRNDHGPIQLPELQPVDLEQAVTIAGRIVDEQGQPIAGATVDISMPITWPKVNNYYFNLGTAVTDDDGQWKFESAPEELSRLSISVEHPEYLRNYLRGSKDLSAIALKRGLTIVGRVLDNKGQPLAAARVRHGNDRFGTDDPTATTDAQGNFKLLNCKSGSAAVTVEAEGFSPQLQTVALAEPHKQGELEFRLEPGHTLKMKVVDSRGLPLDGVTVVSDTWRGLRTLDFRTKTGADGTGQWNNAPPDAVLFDVLKSGYMAARNTPLVAGGGEQIVTLYPELVISGRVLNAETKKNVESFRIVRGQKQQSGSEIYWYDSESQDYTDGKFSYRISEPMLAWQIEISAEGYRPVKSREFKSDEGNATFNVLLKLARGPTGTVVDREGNPVADAEVVLASKGRRAQFQLGHFDSDPSKAEQVFSDATGRFTFSPQEAEQYVVIAVHDSGFAQVTNSELSESSQLRLEPWGRIDGQVRGGSETDTNCDVSFYSQRPGIDRALSSMVGFNYRTHTDAEGHFTMDRVLPGPGSAARVVVIEDGEMTIHSNRSQTPVEVVADQTSRVNIGGGGRSVKGRFVLDRQPAEDVRWRHEPTVSLEKINPETGRRDSFFCREVGPLGKSGEFTINDVPAGDYQVRQRVNAIAADGRQGGEIGVTLFQIQVPAIEGTSDEPYDLGELTIELLDTLEPGEVAPDFVAETHAGGVFRLSELRGKLVVLNFWSTYQTASRAENTSWAKTLSEAWNAEPRLVFLGLSIDPSREQMIETLEQNDWPWMHVYVGPQWATVASRYLVQTLPANFIISPNGRVLRKNVPADELAVVLTELMRDGSLFQPAGEQALPRFPIQRFEVAHLGVEQTAKLPTVLLLADSDPSFETAIPHHDNLIAYDIDGHEMWRKSTFNLAGSATNSHLASDAARNRIYCGENVGNKLWALNSAGQSIWCVSEIATDCVMVDPMTGNIWCSGSGHYEFGETVIFSPEGEELFALPFRAIDMAYDPISDAFWLVGYQTFKISRDGALQLREKVAGWCASSIAVNPHDGRAWIVERGHSDVSESRNRLWLRSSDGDVLKEIVLLDGKSPNEVEWLSNHEGLLSDYKSGISLASVEGELKQILDMPISSLATDGTGGQIWLTTPTNLERIVDGKAVVNVQFTETECSSSIIVYK